MERPTRARLQWLATGAGEPVTVFAHGLGGDIDSTRPLGSAVAGRRIFLNFRGHGRSDLPPGPWGYGDLADDLRTVADLAGARRAVAVSMGAAALTRLLAAHPDRFERLVFFLPAVLDEPRPAAARHRMAALLAAAAAGDADALTAVLRAEVPAGVRDTAAAAAYLRRRAAILLRPGLAAALDTLAGQVALADATVLAAVTAPALVIAGTGDELHPTGVAHRLAAALPRAELVVYDSAAVLWTHRAAIRERISTFLN